ncbi:helix-turn-helix domain-containing protein [Bradyrhizobium sp. HKCCYLRH1030]|uniref:helix-turn-helix domain-containing protein n=1 Tax=Bradyrhizobium sp. HKCCYLRH1030 TaxID=3420744 RepID=UPI003EBD4073
MIARTRLALSRSDLYDRLSTFPILLPALRERAADRPLLAAALLARVAPERRPTLSQPALERLEGYAFPGNVRELRNVLERAALLCDDDVISAATIERALTLRSPDIEGRDRVQRTATKLAPADGENPPSSKEREARALRTALLTHRGNRESLAESLGISLRTLYRKLKELDA